MSPEEFFLWPKIWKYFFTKICLYGKVTLDSSNRASTLSWARNDFNLKISYAAQKLAKMAVYNMLVAVFITLSLCRMVQI